jgi:hypothetical protein
MIAVLAGGILARCGLGAASVAGTALSLALILAAHRNNILEPPDS